MVNPTDTFDVDAEQAAADARLAHIELPAGATTDSAGWSKNLREPGWSRSLEWTRIANGDGPALYIDGRQQDDGTFSRSISLYVDEISLTASGARELAAALNEAAHVLERLT